MHAVLLLNLKSPVLGSDDVLNVVWTDCVQVRLLNTSTLNTDLHLLYRDVTLAVWARLRPHRTIHILVSSHEQELDVLATLCALDLTVFTDLTVGLQCKHQSRRLVMSNQLLIVHIPYESDSM